MQTNTKKGWLGLSTNWMNRLCLAKYIWKRVSPFKASFVNLGVNHLEPWVANTNYHVGLNQHKILSSPFALHARLEALLQIPPISPSWKGCWKTAIVHWSCWKGASYMKVLSLVQFLSLQLVVLPRCWQVWSPRIIVVIVVIVRCFFDWPYSRVIPSSLPLWTLEPVTAPWVPSNPHSPAPSRFTIVRRCCGSDGFLKRTSVLGRPMFCLCCKHSL